MTSPDKTTMAILIKCWAHLRIFQNVFIQYIFHMHNRSVQMERVLLILDECNIMCPDIKITLPYRTKILTLDK